jgi:hypothetical protein
MMAITHEVNFVHEMKASDVIHPSELYPLPASIIGAATHWRKKLIFT